MEKARKTERKNYERQYEYGIMRNARKMKIRCKCKRAEKSLLQCASLTQNETKNV